MNIDKSAGQAAAGALSKYSRRVVLNVIAGQIGVTLVAALVMALVVSARGGYSALVGGGIGILPNYYFAVRLFKRSWSMSPATALRGIYLGEGIKVVFTVALFVLAMRVLDVEVWVVVLAYLLTVAATWVAVLWADLGESPRKGA
ncbi:MAG: hypothetical protein E2O35_01985 [Proteobacteria bacterium]|nr:MAG: hypothetical protein E2O35_01985 [Pseudomonadota bacterium]